MFSIHPAKADRGQLTLSVAGELDFTDGCQLHEAVTVALTTPGIRDLVIDLNDLRFMDSVGISTLLAGWRQAHTHLYMRRCRTVYIDLAAVTFAGTTLLTFIASVYAIGGERSSLIVCCPRPPLDA